MTFKFWLIRGLTETFWEVLKMFPKTSWCHFWWRNHLLENFWPKSLPNFSNNIHERYKSIIYVKEQCFSFHNLKTDSKISFLSKVILILVKISFIITTNPNQKLSRVVKSIPGVLLSKSPGLTQIWRTVRSSL